MRRQGKARFALPAAPGDPIGQKNLHGFSAPFPSSWFFQKDTPDLRRQVGGFIAFRHPIRATGDGEEKTNY